MKQLLQRLEDFFAAFDSDEAVDLTAHKSLIMDELSVLTTEYDRMTEMKKQSRITEEENAELRRIIVNDCRAKLIILGGDDAETVKNDLDDLPLQELKDKREAIVKRFDAQFVLKENQVYDNPGSHDPEFIDLQAFRG